MSRQIVRLFVGYARNNQRIATKLLEQLREQLAPSKHYEYSFWRDVDNILTGDNWDEEIKNALQQCHCGILLVSPAFLSSEYSIDIEWDYLATNDKPVLPVMLEPVDFKRHNLRGLETKQIFQWSPRPGGELRSFADFGATREQRRFVEQLFLQIEQRLDRIFA